MLFDEILRLEDPTLEVNTETGANTKALREGNEDVFFGAYDDEVAGSCSGESESNEGHSEERSGSEEESYGFGEGSERESFEDDDEGSQKLMNGSELLDRYQEIEDEVYLGDDWSERSEDRDRSRTPKRRGGRKDSR